MSMTLQYRNVWPNRVSLYCLFKPKNLLVHCTSKRCFNFTAASRTSKNYYNVLGVPKNASAKQIKDAYFKLAMQHHPDKNQGILTQQFREIKEAYDVLSNESSRLQYNNNSTNDYNSSSNSYRSTSANWTSNSSYGRYRTNNNYQYSRTNNEFKYRNPNREQYNNSNIKSINVFINVIQVPKNVLKTQIDIILLTFIKNRILKLVLFQVFQFVWKLVLENINFNILIPTESPNSALGEFVRSILEYNTVRVQLTEMEAIKGKAVRVKVNDNEKVLIVNIPRGAKKNQSFYLFYLIDDDGHNSKL